MSARRLIPLPLDTQVELSGEWWLPDAPDVTAYGRLVYKPEGGLTLHLASGHDILGFGRSAAWVHGLTVEGRAVTLRNCISGPWTMSIPGGISADVYVEQAFVGMYAASERELSMTSITVRMRSLNEWLGVSGLTVTTHDSVPRTSKFAQPSPVGLVSVQGVRFAASFELQGAAAPAAIPYEITMQQRAWVELTPRRPRRFLELWEMVEQFNDFLSFASGVDSQIEEVLGYARVQSRTFGPAGRSFTTTDPVWVLFARPSFASVTQVAERMLFRHADIRTRNDAPLLRWFRRAQGLRPVYRVYLSGLPTRTLDPEARFLTTVQSLEGYERYVQPRGGRSLERRLENLVARLPVRVRNVVPARFAQLAAGTRDYFSHRIPQLQANAATEDELFPLMNATKLLFELVLLRELGFTQTQIANWALVDNQRLVAQIQRGFLAL